MNQMNQTNNKTTATGKTLTIYQMAMLGLMAALMCILGPMSVPIGPVPVSFTNLIVYLSVFLLGTRLGTLSYLIYFLLGLVGLPVFSGYSGGLAKLAGPTGGFLAGFFLLALISGLFFQKFHRKPFYSIIGMIVGALALNILGTVWFVISTKAAIPYALTVCVLPFIPGDLIKILIAAYIGPLLRRSLLMAGITLPEH